MKFFHLSDLHIGLKLFNRDLLEDQAYILKQIVEKAIKEKPDAVVVAGDIYDKAVPSAEAVQVFDRFISELSRALPEAELMMISGNHDSAPRVDLFRSVLAGQRIRMIGIPPVNPEDHIEKVTLEDSFGNVNFYLLPFVRPSMVRQIVGTDGDGGSLSYNEALHKLIGRENINCLERNVLVSHQFYLPAGRASEDIERMDSEIRTVGNIDQVRADILEWFDYAALGHIHKPMQVGGEAYRYCGTPLACSVSEAGQQKGIIMVELADKGSLKTSVLRLKPLRQVRVIRDSLQEVLKQGCNDYVTVILTDKEDLDVIDMQERIRGEFPNLLEIRRETWKSADYSRSVESEADLDPFELCCSFLGEPEEAERELLRDVLDTVREVR